MNDGEGRAVDEHGANGVEENLERAEESLAQEGIQEESLHGRRKIGIEAGDAEGLVVGEMVWLSGRMST